MVDDPVQRREALQARTGCADEQDERPALVQVVLELPLALLRHDIAATDEVKVRATSVTSSYQKTRRSCCATTQLRDVIVLHVAIVVVHIPYHIFRGEEEIALLVAVAQGCLRTHHAEELGHHDVRLLVNLLVLPELVAVAELVQAELVRHVQLREVRAAVVKDLFHHLRPPLRLVIGVRCLARLVARPLFGREARGQRAHLAPGVVDVVSKRNSAMATWFASRLLLVGLLQGRRPRSWRLGSRRINP